MTEWDQLPAFIKVHDGRPLVQWFWTPPAFEAAPACSQPGSDSEQINHDDAYEDATSCVGPNKSAEVSFSMYGSRLQPTTRALTARADARAGAAGSANTGACCCCCRIYVRFKASYRA